MTDDEKAIDALRELKEALRYADEDKPADVAPRPLVHMLDAVFRAKVDAEQEAKRWKAVAVYLADCHAANAECPPKSLSKHNRRRYRGILEKAVGFLKGLCPNHTALTRKTEDVIERCEMAMSELEV